MGSKRKHFSPLRKKKALFIGRHGEGAENAKKYSKIDVTGKTPVKKEAIVIETPFYDHKVDEDFIFISNEEEDTNTQNSVCNEYIKLSKREEKVIKSKEMLTDISIDACQRILRKQFSVCSGLQDTILGQNLMSKEENGKFVQILHCGTFPWLTVSNINCEKKQNKLLLKLIPW